MSKHQSRAYSALDVCNVYCVDVQDQRFIALSVCSSVQVQCPYDGTEETNYSCL